jgi:hypothetical protein
MSDAAARHQSGSPKQAETACEAGFSLVNPTTGLANDYLNVFNEILLLIEFLPSMPEMTDDALAWQPRSYCEYFQASSIPGARHAAQSYQQVDPEIRAKFESVLARLTEIALEAQQIVATEQAGPDYPESIARSCAETADAMRAGLAYVARLINEGVVPRDEARGKRMQAPAQQEHGSLTNGF